MTIWYKQGTHGELQFETAEALRKIEKLYASKARDVFVTALRDGTHMPGSFHPWGRAFDIRKTSKVLKADIQRSLGGMFDVVEHPTHFHVEYDPGP